MKIYKLRIFQTDLEKMRLEELLKEMIIFVLQKEDVGNNHNCFLKCIGLDLYKELDLLGITPKGNGWELHEERFNLV